MTLEQYLPQLRDVLVEKILPSIKGKDSLTNDKSLKLIFAKLYEAMPLAVRIVVGKDTFVSFCLKQKYSLFPKAKTTPKKAVPAVKKIAAGVSKTKAVVTKRNVATSSKTTKTANSKPSVAKKTVPKQSDSTKSASKTSEKRTTKPKTVTTTRRRTQ